MFNSPILEVAISLVFVYLLFSLLASAAKEMIAGLFNLRGVFLVKGIQSIIGGMTSKYTLSFPDKYESIVQAAANTTLAITEQKPGALVDQFFKSASIQRLMGSRFLIGTDRTPSYISDKDFSAAFLNLVFSNPNIGQQLMSEVNSFATQLPDTKERKALLAFLAQVDRGLPTLKQNIEKWYNDSMDRVSGWYKRNAQLVLVLISLAIVCLLNVDTIDMAKKIYNNQPLRSALVSAAGHTDLSKMVKQYADSTKNDTATSDTAEADTTEKDTSASDTATNDSSNSNTLKHDSAKLATAAHPVHPGGDTSVAEKNLMSIDSTFNAVGLPLGWTCAQWKALDPPSGNFWLKVFGLLLTVLALSLGAPFWFDTLNKFINIRSSGPQPAKSDGSGDGKPKVTTIVR